MLLFKQIFTPLWRQTVKRILIILAIVMTFVVAGLVYWSYFRGPFSGMVVVIDSGHGGVDHGAHGTFVNAGDGKSVEITEDEYVYDVSCRLKRFVEAGGGIAVMTTYAPENKACEVDSRLWNKVIPSDKSEKFTLDDSGVVGGASAGLPKRVAYGNRIHDMLGFLFKVAFVSIHFDSNPNTALEGVSVIAPKGGDIVLVHEVVEAFATAKRVRKLNDKIHLPIVYSGDEKTGTINVLVLSEKANKIRQRLLVELGNFSNADDVYRIRNAEVREDYASLIATGLLRAKQSPEY